MHQEPLIKKKDQLANNCQYLHKPKVTKSVTIMSTEEHLASPEGTMVVHPFQQLVIHQLISDGSGGVPDALGQLLRCQIGLADGTALHYDWYPQGVENLS